MGKVYLVGAGPGDPGLFTLKGKALLKKADVVIYDYLANEELLSYVKEGAEIIYVGKERGKHTLSQEEINQLLIRKVSEGKEVVRLKGGDPFVFGRGGEEAEELAQAGIPFEVVPGISSAMAAPAYAGIPLTHRKYCSSVTIVTGHEDPKKEDSSINWKALAMSGGTLVFLMGMRPLRKNMERLIENGLDPTTPAAIIQWGTMGFQRTLVATVGNLADLAQAKGFGAPAAVVIGGVVELREKLNWFEGKTLFGKKILITRTREQASQLASLLKKEGAETIEFPTIEIKPPDSYENIDMAIEKLQHYQWIIFTSANGVEAFFGRLYFKDKDVRDLKGIKICAIGPKTDQALEKLGLRADLIPGEFISEGIIEALGTEEIRGKKILIPRAEQAREILPQQLRQAEAEVHVVTAYKVAKPFGDAERIKELLRKKKIDLITFTSSSTVKNFYEICCGGEITSPLHVVDSIKAIPVACIGPITKKTAEELGMDCKIMPKEYTIEAMTEAIVAFFKR